MKKVLDCSDSIFYDGGFSLYETINSPSENDNYHENNDLNDSF